MTPSVADRGAGAERGVVEASFDLTPMIDVVLLLIIFFMLSSQFARTEQAPMDLPAERGEAVATTSPNTVFIDMDRRGQLTLAQEVMPLQALAARVGRAVSSTGEEAGAIDVIVRADRSCASAHLNRLAEALARVGVRNWKLATSPPSAGGTQ